MIVEKAFGDEQLARVFVARMREDEPQSLVEFVESVQPPLPREQKWVLIVSTLYGCPAGCLMCDAGGGYRGPLSAAEIIAQLRFLVRRRYPELKVPVPRFKIQFARMGEPLLNPALVEVLERLPRLFDAPGLEPCISTVAPRSAGPLLEQIRAIKDRLYPAGRFQLQFSLHSTDPRQQALLMPLARWDNAQIASFGRSWYRPGDKKVTLNFIVMEGMTIDPEELIRHFDPGRFLVKLTPLNPTKRSEQAGLRSAIDPERPESGEVLCAALRQAGFDVILSIGEVRENLIGSNCGQFISHLEEGAEIGYRLPLADGALS